jgi:hypothetical protein
MADIFISWSSPDAEIVLPVIRRLKQNGLDLVQFEADPDAGSIEQSVQRYIEEACLMVMFVSEKSNERDWLKRESEWAAYRQAEQKRKNLLPILKMIPVLIGDVDLTKLNAFLAKNEDQKRLKVPPPAPQAVNAVDTGEVQPAEALAAGAISEAALQNIVLRICDTLGQPKPIVIPTILLAMTRAQAEEHLDEHEYKKIADLCTAAGMEPFPKALERLLLRYKDTADDFSPFPGEPSLKKIVEAALQPINDAKGPEQPRLWLWWCRDALCGSGPDYDYAVEKISKGGSLVILDSISAEFAPVREQYLNVVQIDTGGRQALLWVPPFTHHTAAFQKYIKQLLEKPPRLKQEYQRWESISSSDPRILLDIATAPSLRSWLYAALRAIGSTPAAVRAASESVRENKRGPLASPFNF